MPELPDIAAYLDALAPRIVGQQLQEIRIASPFLLRTVQPRLEDFAGHAVVALRRIGKRIAIGFDNGYWLVLHLMIAGRLHWRAAGAKLGGRNNLAAFDFPNGSLVLTEAGSKRRASLHVFSDEQALETIDPGGIDIFAIDLAGFRAALTLENRTLKRALTDPRIFRCGNNAQLWSNANTAVSYATVGYFGAVGAGIGGAAALGTYAGFARVAIGPFLGNPIHFAVGVGESWMHGLGVAGAAGAIPMISQLADRFAGSAFQLSIPVLNTVNVLPTEGTLVTNCFTGACAAIGQGWIP